jgi:hypothetical protein
MQKRRLLKEGVEVDQNGRIDLARFRWAPKSLELVPLIVEIKKSGVT